MIVIADTSPLNYLIQIGHADILPALYGRIVVPPAVFAELSSPAAPAAVLQWTAAPAAWLDILTPQRPADAGLLEAKLGPGEQEAILLAQEVKADQIIIDELRGRREAIRRQLRVTGTIGVLNAAARLGLLDLRDTLERLARTNFRIDKALLERLAGGGEA